VNFIVTFTEAVTGVDVNDFALTVTGICQQSELNRALNVVGRAVASRNTPLSILTCCLLGAQDQKLRICATNLEMGITGWIEGEVQGEGEIAVPARPLADLVALFPDDQVRLRVSGKRLHVQCGHSEARFNGIDAGEFPLLPRFSEDGAAHIMPDQLRRLIRQVTYAAAAETTRPALTGVLVKISDEEVVMAATDSFRLSIGRAPLTIKVDEALAFVVPAKVLNEVARILTNQTSAAGIALTPERNQVIFRAADFEVIGQLIESKFPDYDPLIPKSYDVRAVVPVADLLKALRCANIFSREAQNVIRLHVVPADGNGVGKLVVFSSKTESGENCTEVGATVEGTRIELGFNADFLIDALSVMDTADAIVEATQARQPAMLRESGTDGTLHVVMPVYLPS
jgi:DNA polymerase-3 subunit beta